MAVKRKNNTQKRRRIKGGGLFDWLSGKPAEPAAPATTANPLADESASASAPVPQPVPEPAAEPSPQAQPVSVAGPVTAPVAAPKNSFMKMLGFSKGGKRLSKKAKKAKKSKSSKK